MTYAEIVDGLRALRAEDFDWSRAGADGDERLQRLVGAAEDLPDADRFVPELFAVMERLPDANLGSPGPLVHTLEQMNYRDGLVLSVRRGPTALSVWMVNRILNTDLPDEQWEFFLELLASVAANPAANALARQEARHFLKHQTSDD